MDILVKTNQQIVDEGNEMTVQETCEFQLFPGETSRQLKKIAKKYDAEVGVYLRKKREEKGFTLDQVTNMIHLEGFPLGEDKVRHMETGYRRISAVTFMVWVKVLGVDLSDPKFNEIMSNVLESE